MGVDFLKSKQRKFAKGWDAERVAASKRRLFGGSTALPACDVVARTIGTNTFREGDEVLVRADGERLSVVVDLAPAAVFLEPTPAVVSAVRESGGYARATVYAAYPTLGLVKMHLQ